ncbi:hypothetical protein [uncultured Cohaesibacter sp.]|uniref:hypothetical protein n=1 Tax=uncultured Cohaesibacter sp. TaxID=1002546 RepID=UPI0029C6B5E1|nr:hypothetical protein [uncultured Cohaesibacter sp.]
MLKSFAGDWDVDDTSCRSELEKWRDRKLAVTAFAVSQSGRCAWTESSNSLSDAKQKALDYCETNVGENCKVIETYEGDWTPSQNCKDWMEDNWEGWRHVKAVVVARNGQCQMTEGYGNLTEAQSAAERNCRDNFGSDCRLIKKSPGDWTMTAACHNDLNRFMAGGGKGAFAVGLTGGCSGSWGGNNSFEWHKKRALRNCAKHSTDCKITWQRK